MNASSHRAWLPQRRPAAAVSLPRLEAAVVAGAAAEAEGVVVVLAARARHRHQTIRTIGNKTSRAMTLEKEKR